MRYPQRDSTQPDSSRLPKRLLCWGGLANLCQAMPGWVGGGDPLPLRSFAPMGTDTSLSQSLSMRVSSKLAPYRVCAMRAMAVRNQCNMVVRLRAHALGQSGATFEFWRFRKLRQHHQFVLRHHSH
jgi:hypothetical protein